MFNLYKIRFYIFLIGCIGSRTLFTVLSRYASSWFLMILGIIALIPVYGWFYIIFFSPRDTGFEVFGELIWWKKLRYIHMCLWAFFAYLAIRGNPSAWIVLAVDTVLGMSSFFIHHWHEGNLLKML